MAVSKLRIAIDANITLSGAQTIQAVALAAGNVVGVFAQNNGAENGIYVVQTTGWTRHPDYDAAAEFVPNDPSTEFRIAEGTYAGWRWRFANDTAPTTLNTDILNFAPYLRPEVETAGAGIEEEDGVFSLPDSGVASGTYGTDAPLIVGTKGQVVGAEGVTYGSETYIRGLTVVRGGTNEIESRLGRLWMPSEGRVYEATNRALFGVPSNATAGFWYCYWRVLGNVIVLEATVTPPAGLSYVTGASSHGARQISSATRAGTTADQYRYVGAVLVAAGGDPYPFTTYGDGDLLELSYNADTTTSPFRRLTDGIATTATEVDCSAVVPQGARQICLMVRNRSDKSCLLLLQDNNRVLATVPAGAEIPVWIQVNFTTRIFKYQLTSAPTAGGVTFDVLGYRDWR